MLEKYVLQQLFELFCRFINRNSPRNVKKGVIDYAN